MRKTIISSVFVLLFPQLIAAPGTAARILKDAVSRPYAQRLRPYQRNEEKEWKRVQVG